MGQAKLTSVPWHSLQLPTIKMVTQLYHLFSQILGTFQIKQGYHICSELTSRSSKNVLA